MRVLVIGGTLFIGRHVVDRLLERGADVTLVTRGKTHPDLYPEARHITLDRKSEDLSALSREADWDAVIDMCGYYPADVERLLNVIQAKTRRYIFVSTISVYAALEQEGPMPYLTEECPMLPCSAEEAIDTAPALYGKRKAACERVIEAFTENALDRIVLRPSLVYGKWDFTDRFAYWIDRATTNEPFILPEDGVLISQKTYAPDLAQAIVNAVDANVSGYQVYNAAEFTPLSIGEVVQSMGRIAGVDALNHAVSVSRDRLLEAGVQPWSDLPLWLPSSHLRLDTFRIRRDLLSNDTAAEQALAEAIDAFKAESRELKAGLSRERERELLLALKAEHVH